MQSVNIHIFSTQYMYAFPTNILIGSYLSSDLVGPKIAHPPHRYKTVEMSVHDYACISDHHSQLVTFNNNSMICVWVSRALWIHFTAFSFYWHYRDA